MRSLWAAFATLALLATSAARADPPELMLALPDAQRVGEAHYGLLNFARASAELYAPHANFSWDRPFAVALTYQHSPNRRDLINGVIREMGVRGAGSRRELAPMRAQLDACVPDDVARGDRFTGVSTGRDTALLYYNGAALCEIAWPNLRHYFFGILLDGRDGAAAVLSARLRGDD